mmetsp:Transcript_19670/g.32253  ORF Transcript_19670/g.32253 Transcript_19670/m.32253 type:complete len:299 (+) Transcript_19670:96-992(+)
MIVFATVGTTSFDALVSSLCSLPSLSTIAGRKATSYHHHRQKTPSPSKHSHSSSPSASEPLSTSTLPAAIPLEQSCSTSVRSYSSYPPSSSGPGDVLAGEGEAATLELVIQYGKGTCPLSFIPPSLKRTSVECNVHENDDNGSISLIVPTNNSDGTQQNRKMHVKWYRFQPSLLQDMERADIILCHAGAGTLLEALAIRREQRQPPIINAVINSTLMNNHQSELAEELEKRKHITVTFDCTSEWTTEEEAKEFWIKLGKFQPVPFACRGDSAQINPNNYVSSFQRIVDGVMSVEYGHM